MFYALGGAEAGAAGTSTAGVYTGDVDTSIVAAPAGFPGARAFEVDPVNGDAGLETYGWRAPVLQHPSLLTVPFMFRFTATAPLVGFDVTISIAELGPDAAAGGYARRLTMSDEERLRIEDEDGDTISETAVSYLAKDTTYWILWYVDLRDPVATRDIAWVFPDGGAWDKALDTSGHGDGDPAVISRITFGTRAGKGLPTEGGPFWVKEMAAQVLNVAPNLDPIGSVTTRFKVPTANGTDGDFDAGTGGNPDWNYVKEIPPDGDTSYDEGDVNEDKQSYEIADADGGDTPLAIQVIGSGKKGAGTSITKRVYLYDGVARDEGGQSVAAAAYNYLHTIGIPFNDVNGAPITEALFNSLEAGVWISHIISGGTYRLTQIGLEYIVTGPKALPGDFPSGLITVPRSFGTVIG